MTLTYANTIIWKSGQNVILSFSRIDIDQVVTLIEKECPDASIVKRGSSVDIFFPDGFLGLVPIRHHDPALEQ